MDEYNRARIEKTVKSLEVDRLMKLMEIEARKDQDGHYVVMSFTTGYKVMFGSPPYQGEYEATLNEIPGGMTLKDALVYALMNKPRCYATIETNAECA